ncbi:MAG TPA: amidohydrolase [Thermoplasmata archaeon]|nr:amidohydrolase [Thermoplasmata archaeon]
MSEPTLWTNARVFSGSRYAEALLIDQGAVVAIGTETEVRRAAPTGTNVVSLHGRLVLPGLIDAHLHLGDLARYREGLDVSAVVDLEDLLSKLRNWALAHPSGPIVGRGLDLERSLHGRWPTQEELDRAVADRPLIVYQASGHAAVANRAALEVAGVWSGSADVLGNRVGRTADGKLNGVLYEEALRWLGPVAAVPLDPEAVLRALRYLGSMGLTTVASMNAPPEENSLVRALAAAHHLPIRVRVYVRLLRLTDFRAADLGPTGPPGMFRVTGTKGFVDGAFGPRTALLTEPYADAPETSGLAVESDAALADALASARALGLTPALHAIGDAGVLRAAHLLAPYCRDGGPRPRIEHVALTPPPVLAALDPEGPALVVQPGFVWSDSWLADRLGSDRARWAYTFRTLLDRDHLVAGSSDAPYDPTDPWRGLRASTERRDELGRSANPDPGEALGFEEAVRLYTVNAASALGEPSLGSLEEGSKADLVILDTTSLREGLRAGARAVRETWVDGRRVFDVSAGDRGELR